MYVVSLFNNGNEIVINEVNTNTNNRVTGTIKKGINTIDTFTFDILSNNRGYNSISPFLTKIEIWNTKLNKLEFRGRVLTCKPAMSESGLLKKSVVCESDLGYLCDTSQRWGEYHNKTVKEYLQLLIDTHNKNTTPDKKFELGNVTVKDNNDSVYRYTSYENTWKNIQDDLLDKLGGELQVRYDNGVRILDYVEQRGEKKDLVIRLGRNMKSISGYKNPTDIITRLVPLGNKLKNSKGEDTEERLTIKSVNNGIDFIDYEEAIEKFGVIEGTYTWDNVTKADMLLKKGNDYLKSLFISSKWSITALDLSLIGLEHDAIDIANTYRIINPLMDIDEDIRVVEVSIPIENPQSATYTVGEKFEDIKTYQVSIKSSGKNAREALLKANKAIEKNIQLEENLLEVGGTMENTNINITEITKLIGKLTEIVENNTKSIEEIKVKLDEIGGVN